MNQCCFLDFKPCLSPSLYQRNRVWGWEMKGGDKPVFTQRSEMTQLELPPGTVLEVELAQELEGEVGSVTSVSGYLLLG